MSRRRAMFDEVRLLIARMKQLDADPKQVVPILLDSSAAIWVAAGGNEALWTAMCVAAFKAVGGSRG